MTDPAVPVGARLPTDDSGTTRSRVVLVAAVADNGVIGAGGDMPWHIPEDLKHFRAVTRGNPVVMGRVTFESIGRPLPERTNIVVTRDPAWSAEGVTVAHSVDEALAVAERLPGDVMVIGGAQIYEAALPASDVQVLTEVHQTPDGDTFYPPFDRAAWAETWREEHDGFAFVRLERR